ncbi:MAG: UbiA family prenyltransferase [Anaerolineae bacterium]|nr:UbiA family prenyltransferase [Anaerolineae bacterium]
MRALLYRLTPRLAPYILHLRPASMGIVFVQVSVGFLLANGLRFGSGQLWRWLLGYVVWAVFLHGGTLALNSAFDKDEGDIGYLENPPPPPRYLLHFGLGMMLAGVALASLLGWRYLLAVSACFVMSILYSVPPMRLKARAGFDLLINMIGYGGLTTYAGWAAMARPLEPPMINVFIANAFFMGGFYPLTQIYQMEEDASRGDYTLALALGRGRALLAGMLGVGLGFVFLAIEVLQRWRDMRSLGLLLGLAAWGWVLLPWYRRRAQADVAYDQRRFYHALAAGAVTDLAIILAMLPR